jgi:hypothetical protein
MSAYLMNLSAHSGTFPVQGKIFGHAHRLFAPMVVTKGSTRVQVIFLIDMCSPATYLRADTMRALLGLDESAAVPDYGVVARINGGSTQVYLSHGRFANVDLLGSDFLSCEQAKLVADYDNRTFSIEATTR